MKEPQDRGSSQNPFLQMIRRMAELRKAGIDPAVDLSAEMSTEAGFELAHLAQAHFQHQALRNQFADSQLVPQCPEKKKAIGLGPHAELGTPVSIHRDKLTENLLVIGAVGSGKTNYLLFLLEQLATQDIQTVFYDFKGESTRLLNVYA